MVFTLLHKLSQQNLFTPTVLYYHAKSKSTVHRNVDKQHVEFDC